MGNIKLCRKGIFKAVLENILFVPNVRAKSRHCSQRKSTASAYEHKFVSKQTCWFCKEHISVSLLHLQISQVVKVWFLMSKTILKKQAKLTHLFSQKWSHSATGVAGESYLLLRNSYCYTTICQYIFLLLFFNACRHIWRHLKQCVHIKNTCNLRFCCNILKETFMGPSGDTYIGPLVVWGCTHGLIFNVKYNLRD